MTLKTFWRIIAILIMLIWAIVFFAYNAFVSETTEPKYMVLINNSFSLFAILLSALLIIFPTAFVLYVPLCCVWGMIHLLDGGGTNGFIMYGVGCIFAVKSGYRIKTLLKIIPFVVPPLIAVASQYRLGMDKLITSIIELIFLVIVLLLCYSLYNESFFTSNSTKILKKADLTVLKQSELEVLKEVLANKTYSTIGNERNKSESSIKLVMQDVYAKLKLKGKKELMDLYERKMIELPEN